MGLLKLALFGACTVAVIAFVSWLSKTADEEISDTPESEDEIFFKSEIYSDVFTLEQAKEWIHSRTDLISDTTKCCVFKKNSELGSSLLKGGVLTAGEKDNCLGIIIINAQSKTPKDSILIRYGTLDAELEEKLGPEGMLVITGGSKC